MTSSKDRKGEIHIRNKDGSYNSPEDEKAFEEFEEDMRKEDKGNAKKDNR